MATAIESIYRDMEYARLLMDPKHKKQAGEGKGASDDSDSDIDEERPHKDTKHRRTPSSQASPDSRSGYSSSASAQGAASEDWSVISDQEDNQSSRGSQLLDGKAKQDKRRSFTAAVLSVLPDSLTAGTSAQGPASPSHP